MNSVALYADIGKQGREDEVMRHAPLVKRIAYHLLGRLPATVQADDLIQAGMVGLLEAIRNYDPTQGASFETYAGIRIRGAMLDDIRTANWAPRSVNRKVRELTEAVRRVENREGRDARDSEVAEEMGISLDEYHQILRDAACTRIFSLDEFESDNDHHDFLASDSNAGPLEHLQHHDFKQALSETIKSLPEREQLVLSMYYDEELNLREIGEVLEVSESRVCQIHGQALVRLRARLSQWLSELE